MDVGADLVGVFDIIFVGLPNQRLNIVQVVMTPDIRVLYLIDNIGRKWNWHNIVAMARVSGKPSNN